jgi:hypothetical protein
MGPRETDDTNRTTLWLFDCQKAKHALEFLEKLITVAK